MMFALARARGEQVIMRSHRNGAWHSLSWARFARQCAAAARALRAAGVSAGDRVLLVSENRPDFLIAEIALQSIRAVPVPTYVTNTIADHAHIIADSGARAAIVSTAALAERVAQAGVLDLLVCMEPGAPSGIDWAALADGTADFGDIAAEAGEIPSGALAVIIYTSGTGGAPRGVMLPHRALLANIKSVQSLIGRLNLGRDEVYLSFLPLAHAYEHTVGGFILPLVGAEVVYSRGVEHLAADMLTVRPSLIAMVPRLLDVLRSRILGQVAREPAWKQKMFHAAIAIGRKRVMGKRLALWERLADPILERLVRSKLRARFGGRFRIGMSGGARLDPELGRFFQAIGLTLLQGYGQTEAGPLISAVAPPNLRLDNIGFPVDGVECRIAADGEILVRGDLLMDGYWGRPEETARTIIDGWLHTGDVGQIEPDGTLSITDRKRDIIVLSGGENVAPGRIEAILTAEPAIAQAVVAGDGRASLSALLVAAEGAGESEVAVAVARVNKTLSVTERVRRHVLVEPFTMENGLLTATQKIRRHLVIKAHQALLEG
jgi:long-chain acyl-CoA synthetase